MCIDKKAGNRNTIQRTAVLTAVRKLYHPTADEVYNFLHEQYPTLSKGTVYRNLNLLTDMGELMVIRTASGADRFDGVPQTHYHFQCRICGKLFDVDMPVIENLEQGINDLHGFIVEGHQIVFTGICPDCKNK